MAKFTIGEIAARVARPGESVGTVTDKLKNWVSEGLLRPSSVRHPGTGHHRRFNESALIDAQVLCALTDEVGVTAVRASSFKRLFEIARESFKKPIEPDRFVVVAFARDGRAVEIGFSHSVGLAQLLADSPHDVHVVLNLSRLFQRLEAFDQARTSAAA